MTERMETCTDLSLLDLVDLLYDAATNPGRWRLFLEAAARHFDAFSANLIHYDAAQPERSMAYLTGYDALPAEIRGEAMRTLVAAQADDPRVRYSFEHPCKPFHCRQIESTEALHASPAYQTFLKPNGVEYSLMVTLADSPDRFSGLGLLRGPQKPGFGQDDVNDLGRLVPHLRRAMSVHDRLSLLDHATQSSYQVLENLPTGIAILHADGRLDYANAVARAIFDRRDGLEIKSGRVVWQRRRGMDDSQELLRRIVEGDAHHALVVERPTGRTPFRCILSRLSPDVATGLPNLFAAPRIMLCLSDPEQSCETSEELLQRMFGLTPAEARLTRALVAGFSLQEAANQAGIQVSTARSRLKDIFRKIGVNSQTDLVRSVLSSPLWLVGESQASKTWNLISTTH